MKSLLGRKIGMTQVFNAKGACVPVTLVRVDRCVPILERTLDKDGYQAVLVTYGEAKKKHTNKPLQGFYDKFKVAPGKVLKEFRGEVLGDSEIGESIKADVFAEGDLVDVVGVSKGKGFAGVFKRHGFGGAPASHGHHEIYRGGGSIGMHTYPGRVWKGKKMAGRMGGDTVHVKNLKIVSVDSERNIILIRGCLPGANGQLVQVTGLKGSKV